jgi:uncharacterized protein YggE
MTPHAFALLGFLTVGFLPPAQAEPRQALVPSLTVVGSGKASASPDMAKIQVGVVTEAPAATKALKDNNDAMARLFSALEARGIPRKDMQTSNFSVVPEYKRGPHGEQLMQIIGYRVSNEVGVKVRKLDSLGAILDVLVKEGANQIHGISFLVAEPTPVLDAARRKAMADARRKAELYAKESGLEVGRVLLIQEQTPRLPGGRVLAGFARSEAGSVPIAEGEQEFEASITVTYAIGAGPSSRTGRTAPADR